MRHHVIRDQFTGARLSYPMSKADSASHEQNFLHFRGPASNAKATVLVRMDEDEAIMSATKALKWLPEPDLPNRWPHNSSMERDIREEKECERAIHFQSGFDYASHSFLYEAACMSLNFDKPAKNNPDITQWEAQSGSAFDGPRLCIGQLVRYRRKDQMTLEPNLAPALFVGWHVDSGFRYNDVVKVIDYQKWKAKSGEFWDPIKVPTGELFVEEGAPVFPLAAARDHALHSGGTVVLPDIETKEIPFGTSIPEPILPAKRKVYITLERLIKWKRTPGCKGCEGSGKHTPECVARFTELVAKEREEVAEKATKEPVSEEPIPDGSEPSPSSSSAPKATSTISTPTAIAIEGEEEASEPSASSALAAVLKTAQATPALQHQPERSGCKCCQPIKADKEKRNKGKMNRISTTPQSGSQAIDTIFNDAMQLFHQLQLPQEVSAVIASFASKADIVSQHCADPHSQQGCDKKSSSLRSLSGYGTMFEFCCDEHSNMGTVHEKYGIHHVRLCKSRYDLTTADAIEQLMMQVEATPGADIWGALPCTAWSSWQKMSIARYGKRYAVKLEKRRKASIDLFMKF